MRIAIFDGILETHVASSFERALVARGHQVFNTGKIGQGFEFPAAGADIGHLETAVGNVLEFRPDVVFVMRPASLPHRLIDRFKRRGIPLAVWLSDDPVLFHLTYAPLLERYDYVLHCGTATVLQHYEDFFGRPTGVNFPFWTDHQAFPYVWGSEAPESEVMFLGNVHDAVRRRRYFSIAQLRANTRIHGNTGADYLGLGAGYLDSDAEVVSAGAAAQLALNIPQYFKDHRGLPTWFPGLGELGFFEYPSRVIQYIAMGLPVVSIVPGVDTFESLPEMVVVENMEEADRAITELLAGDMPALSQAMEARFSRNFSATARAIAFEALLEDDTSWRSLDARERNLWFTQFDGSAPSNTPEPTYETISIAPHQGGVVVVGDNFTQATSRAAVTLRALSGMGFHAVPYEPGTTVALPPGALAGIVVCGSHLTAEAPSVEGNPWKILFHERAHAPRDLAVPLVQFDAIGVPDYSLATQLRAAGHANVFFTPPSVDQTFITLCSTLEPAPVVQTHVTPGLDMAFAPALVSDVTDDRRVVQSYSALRELDLEQLARALRASVGLIGLGGNRGTPLVDPLTPFAAAASDVVVMPRIAPPELFFPYGEFAVQVRDRGELTHKLQRIGSSATAMAAATAPKTALFAEEALGDMIGQCNARRRAPSGPGQYPQGLPYAGMVTKPLDVGDPPGTQLFRWLDISLHANAGRPSHHAVRIYHEGVVLLEAPAREHMEVVVQAAAGTQLGRVMVDLRYVGPPTVSPAEDLAAIECSAQPLVDKPTTGLGSGATRAWIIT